MNPNQQPTLEQQMFQKKIAEFQSKLTQLETESGIVMIPTLSYTKHGIIPQLEYADKAKIDALRQKMEEEALAK